MTDSFADLWNTSAPTKPPSTSGKTLGSSLRLTSNRPSNGPNDHFSRLAASPALPGSSRSNTPSSRLTPNIPSKSSTPISTNLREVNDSFSDLLTGSFSTEGSRGKPLKSLAERQAESTLRQQQQKTDQQKNAGESVWDGLDLIGGESSQALLHSNGVDQFDFATVSNSAAAPTSLVSDDWDLTDYATPQPVKAMVVQSSSSILDTLDAHDEPRQFPEPTRSGTPGDFDFGNREDQLLGNDSSDEEDLLGELGRPVQPKTKRYLEDSRSNRQDLHSEKNLNQSSGVSGARPVSPPPHIIGQLVEMGFGPVEARLALAATDTGLDVQQALEMLLANVEQPERPLSGEPKRRERPPTSVSPSVNTSNRAPALIPSRSTASSSRVTSQMQSLPISPEVQERATELLSQASEFGLNVFNKANALWKEGKQKVQKAYEERSGVPSGSSRQSQVRPDGRPKWMTDAHAYQERDVNAGQLSEDKFTDRPHHELIPSPPRLSTQDNTNGKRHDQGEAPRSRLENLLGDDMPAYVSPSRRRVNTSRDLADPDTPKASTPQATCPPSPPPLRSRQCISTSSSVLTSSASYKSRGTEQFKLGQYAEAASSYTQALNILPENHLLRIPLWTNRALARMRSGDHKGAHEDCSSALEVIGIEFNPNTERKVEKVEEGAEVDLKEGFVKALRRRAEAAEGREKWEEAQCDWERLSALDWAPAKIRSEAGAAAARCRKMLKVENGQESLSSSRPVNLRPKPKPTSKTTSALSDLVEPRGEAVEALRISNAAAESEDAMRHSLKDSVDAKLLSWKSGKETNIRALIASLDLVLWPELGWVKVGMGELISEKQLKIRYTKAIAKLHPDKLVHGTTLEQRMIANGVFSTLNDAWNAFKQ